MENLLTVLNILDMKKDKFEGSYYMPETWNFSGFPGYTRCKDREGEIAVNPYEFMAYCIRSGITANVSKSKGLENDTFDLAKSVIYSMLPRMLTAWNHDDSEKICYGTFLKAICLLPYLKSMNTDIIYLLPVFKSSQKYKKGDSGSPYAIKDIYRLDENLHDSLLGECDDTLLETEFKAFVEACHLLGMKVMLDFAFRTVSRDNDLMVEHPDWFYWIDLKHNETFAAPAVNRFSKPMSVSERSIEYLYKARGLKEYLFKFTPSPKDVDEAKWERLVLLHRQTGRNMLELIEREFGVTTVPGFSDVINDKQPPWTDVTYLRFFYDNHAKAREYVDECQPPYIMQDGVCLKLYRGDKENRELREYVSDVIPYYQDKFGIDGARIDMGHALSPDLNKDIVAKAKAKNRDFILWSEEFHPKRAEAARDDGFDFISGYIWSIYKESEKSGFSKKLLTDTLMKAVIPVTAALETPDTPRAALVHKDRNKLRQLVLINCFIPNAIPFINNGQEIMEIQPMNLGLDNTDDGKLVLEKDDPMYGRLAFFDNYRMHWLNSGRTWMQELLLDAFSIRKKFIDIISVKENFVLKPELIKNKKLIHLCYYDSNSSRGVFLLANRSFKTRARANLAALFPEQAVKEAGGIRVIYAGGKICDQWMKPHKGMLLEPGEVIIGCIG